MQAQCIENQKRPGAAAAESRTEARTAAGRIKTETALSTDPDPNLDPNPASKEENNNDTYTPQMVGNCPAKEPEDIPDNN